jgi:hypothetical protein
MEALKVMALILVFTISGLAGVGMLARHAFLARIADGERWLRSRSPDQHLGAEHADDLAKGAPELVRTFVKKVLKNPKSAIGSAFSQQGVMVSKPGAGEMKFEAMQVMSALVPGFTWRATMALGPMVVTVCDRLVDGEGGLQARLLGAFPIAKLEGPAALKGQLMRYLAETPWAPQALLQVRELRWRQIGEREVEVRAELNGVEARVKFEFDVEGFIKKISASDRPRDIGGGRAVPTPWVGEYSNYRVVGGVMIPTHAEVSWILETGRFTYFKGDIVEYSMY